MFYAAYELCSVTNRMPRSPCLAHQTTVTLSSQRVSGVMATGTLTSSGPGTRAVRQVTLLAPARTTPLTVNKVCLQTR